MAIEDRRKNPAVTTTTTGGEEERTESNGNRNPEMGEVAVVLVEGVVVLAVGVGVAKMVEEGDAMMLMNQATGVNNDRWTEIQVVVLEVGVAETVEEGVGMMLKNRATGANKNQWTETMVMEEEGTEVAKMAINGEEEEEEEGEAEERMMIEFGAGARRKNLMHQNGVRDT